MYTGLPVVHVIMETTVDIIPVFFHVEFIEMENTDVNLCRFFLIVLYMSSHLRGMEYFLVASLNGSSNRRCKRKINQLIYVGTPLF
jgi:hypothetical protein